MDIFYNFCKTIYFDFTPFLDNSVANNEESKNVHL